MEFKAQSQTQPLSSASVTIVQSIAVYLHVYNCLVIIIEYKSALHAMTLMGGAAASETLIGGCICRIGGCSTRQNTDTH